MTYSSRIKHWACVCFCAALVLGLTIPQAANAQALYGSLTGTVADQSGATIPGAEVTATNDLINFSQTVITSDNGTFLFKSMSDGVYRVNVGMSGFKEFVAENVVVQIGGVTRLVATLEVGDISETVTVSSSTTVLKTDTTDVNVQLETKEISDLPLGAYRNYQSLVNLVPGATPGRFQNAVTDTPGRALTTNINGTNRNSNNTRIDGAQSVNIWLPHHTAYVPPAETVEVVNISTNNFDAEQGFAGGAATTVVTKSGTNSFHGTAFALHENSETNARDFFLRGDKPSGKRNIDGATIGGPIIKDKLFFFAGFEGSFERLAKTSTATVATAAQRAGDFSAFLPVESGGTCTSNCTVIYDPFTGDAEGNGKTPFAGNIVPTDRMSSQALAMQNLMPLPNISDGLTSNFQRSGSQNFDRYNTDIKIDWYSSDEHRFWGKYSWMDAEVAKDTLFGPGGGGAIGGGGDGVGLTDVKVYGFGHNWTLSPNFLVDGNFGFTDMDQEVLPSDLSLGNFGQDVLGIPGTNATDSQSCPEGRCGGIPRFSVDGFNSFGQTDGWSPIFRDEDSYTFTHNFSYSRSAHEFRFGYDMVNHALTHWQPEIGDGPRGRFNFNRQITAVPGGSETNQNAYAAFLMGVNRSAGKSLQWEEMTTREWQHAWYIRDRWQVTPNLTFTLGLRYEFFPLVSREGRNMEFLDLATHEVVLDNNISVSKGLFAPRLGFAYRMGQNNVLRAGYGITNNPLPFGRPLRGFFPLTIAGNFNVDASHVPGLDDTPAGQGSFTTLADGIPIFQGPAAGEVRVPLPSFTDMRTMPADKINRGYIQSWNMIYERKLPSDVVVSLGYVGTQTVRQLADNQINWSPPGGGNAGRQFADRSSTNIRYWDGWLSSNYHSLQFSLNRRFTNGLFLKGAYTYSHAINMTDDDGWAGLSWNDPALISRNRANAGYNLPHVFQLATIYELPFGQGSGGANALIRDWQINGIFSANNARQFGVGGGSINTRSNSQTADQVKSNVVNLGGIGADNPYYDPTAFAAVTRVPGETCTNLDCYGSTGRNILRGPSRVNLDLSIFRMFPITEEVGLEFRVEAFNFANNPKFNNPNGTSTSSAFMTITSTDSNAPARVMRFGLKLRF